MVTTSLKSSLDIPWNHHGTRYGRPRLPSLHKVGELVILDNLEWAIAFCTPPCNVCPIQCDEWMYNINDRFSYLASSLVCARWDTVTGCWPGQAKVAKIDSFQPLTLVLFAAALTASIPKHFVAWVFRLDVAAQSFKSKYCWTVPVPLHFLVAHWKRWNLWPFS